MKMCYMCFGFGLRASLIGQVDYVTAVNAAM